MEKGFESWFRNQQIDPKLSSAPFGFQHRLNGPYLGNPVSPNLTNENLPMFTFTSTNPQESRGWFKGLTPMVNSIPKQQFLDPRTTHEGQKKFLVFDQSNDRTTLVYTSTPTQFHLPKPHLTFNPINKNSVMEKHDDNRFSNTFLDDGNDDVSEMHEDTEELEALLYSDSDDDEFDYSEDEEEQSTGHSPNTMVGSAKHECGNESNPEEVASSNSCHKRRKLETGKYDVVSLEDTASSGKSGVYCSSEVELSTCGNGNDSRVGIGFPGIESDSLRARKEKVKETIKVLEDLIPGGKSGKDAMMIIDDAISYLRILKVKAKALGLDSL